MTFDVVSRSAAADTVGTCGAVRGALSTASSIAKPPPASAATDAAIAIDLPGRIACAIECARSAVVAARSLNSPQSAPQRRESMSPAPSNPPAPPRNATPPAGNSAASGAFVPRSSRTAARHPAQLRRCGRSSSTCSARRLAVDHRRQDRRPPPALLTGLDPA